MKRFGNLDIPILNFEQDKLFMESQIRGMASFIEECATPMTISIQGSWGSGKTSFVNMVVDRIKKDLGENAKKDFAFVPFNTWQFIQFNLSDQLCASMVTAITKELSKDIKSDPTVKERVDRIINGVEVLKTGGRLAAIVLNELVKEKADVDILSSLKEAGATDTARYLSKETTITAVETIQTLQNDLKKTIEARLGITEETLKTLSNEELNRKRVIVFVDDLDRLPPDTAIDVLETLKMFFENNHCIFLLAIDQDVVVNGVTIKFKNTINADKGRDFFEKLIQVVFTLPDKMTNTDQYIAYLLQESGESIANSYEFSEFVHSAGKENPRAVKRLINSYKLVRMMLNQSYGNNDLESSSVVIFAMLCLQSTCQDFYEAISSIFAGKCNYVKCLQWFNRLHKYVFDIYHYGHSSITISENRLHKWNLLKDSDPDPLKVGLILKVFDHATSTLHGIYNPGHQLIIQDILRIRDVLKWTNLLSRKVEAHSGLFSVAIVDVEECKEVHLKSGTPDEAYRTTFENILSVLLSERYGAIDVIKDDPWFGHINETKILRESTPQNRLALIADLLEGLITLNESDEKKTNWHRIQTPFGTVKLNEFSDEDTFDLVFLKSRIIEIVAKFLGIRFTWYADRFKSREVLEQRLYSFDMIYEVMNGVPFIEVAGKVFSNTTNRKIEEAYCLTVESMLSQMPLERIIEIVKAHPELFRDFSISWGYQANILNPSDNTSDHNLDDDNDVSNKGELSNSEIEETALQKTTNSSFFSESFQKESDTTNLFTTPDMQNLMERTGYADDLDEFDPIPKLDDNVISYKEELNNGKFEETALQKTSNSSFFSESFQKESDTKNLFTTPDMQNQIEKTGYADDLDEFDPIPKLNIQKGFLGINEFKSPIKKGNWRDIFIFEPEQCSFQLFIGSEDDLDKKSYWQFNRIYELAKELDIEFKWYSDEYMQDTILEYSHITQNNMRLGAKYLKKIYAKYPQLFY